MLKHTLVLCSVFYTQSVFAQAFELPRPSPNAKVVQTVGLTEIAVEYSSPAVKGRKVFGDVVKLGEIWRAGANAATKVSFSKDVTIGGAAVPAGAYSLFVIPQAKGNWTVVFNKDPKASVQEYKKEQDVVRVDVKPETIPSRERLQYTIVDFTNEQANLALEWEKVRIKVPVTLGTDAQVAASIKQMEDGAAQPYLSTARYMLEQKKDYDTGLKYVDKALSIKEDWLASWTKAQLLAAKGNKKDALPFAQKAQQLGEQNPQRFFFAQDVKAALNDWKKAAN
jgi:tetratricopeptide (TPR) repeat protein